MAINSQMLLSALSQLQQQGQGQFSGAIPPAIDPATLGASKPAKVPEPDAAFASAPTNAYYNVMQAKSMDPFFGGGHLAALKNDTASGQDAYMEQLAAVQKQTADANQRAGQQEVVLKTMDKLPDAADKGVARSVDVLGIGNNDEYLLNDMMRTNTADAANYGTYGKGTKDFYDAGVVPDVQALADLVTPIFAEQGIDLKSYIDENGFTPELVIKMKQAEAAMKQAEASGVRAQAAMVNANRPRGTGKSDGDDDDSDKMGTGLFTMPSSVVIGKRQ